MSIDKLEIYDYYREIVHLCIERRRLWVTVEDREKKIAACQKELEATKGELEECCEEISKLQGLCRKHKIKFIKE